MDNEKEPQVDPMELLRQREAATPLYPSEGTIEQRPRGGIGKAQTVIEAQEARERYKMPAHGYTNVPVETLPSQGMFYPEGTQIEITSAKVGDIRFWSTISEQDYVDVDEKLNYIIQHCSRIIIPGFPSASWKDLMEVDRFALIFHIRDITFKHGEHRLNMRMLCPTCGSEKSIDVTNEHIAFFKVDDIIKDFYDPRRRCFSVNMDNGEEVLFSIPSAGVMDFIKKFIRTKGQAKEYFDRTFLQYAPYVIMEHRGLTQATYEAQAQESLMWSLEVMSVLDEVKGALENGINLDVQTVCDNCGAEVTAPLSFPGGLKTLFLIPKMLSKLSGGGARSAPDVG